MNVVMLDDERISLAVLKNQIDKVEHLQGFGFTHPTEALRWCAANATDAVILDFMMHEMDGLQFVEQFRLLPGTADVPVLMVTGLRDVELQRRARLLGVNEFFHKPLDVLALRTRLTALLAERSKLVYGNELGPYETLPHHLRAGSSPLSVQRERRTSWRFLEQDEGWTWAVHSRDGADQRSALSFRTLRECVEDARSKGYKPHAGETQPPVVSKRISQLLP